MSGRNTGMLTKAAVDVLRYGTVWDLALLPFVIDPAITRLSIDPGSLFAKGSQLNNAIILTRELSSAIRGNVHHCLLIYTGVRHSSFVSIAFQKFFGVLMQAQ